MKLWSSSSIRDVRLIGDLFSAATVGSNQFKTLSADTCDLITRTALAYGAGAQLWVRLHELNLLASLNQDIARKLAAHAAVVKQMNAIALRELSDLLQIFDVLAVKPILLKGAAYLATDTYHQAEYRKMVDLDILVPPDRFQDVVDALLQNNYQSASPISDYFYNDNNHHFPPLRGKHGTHNIEIHRDQLSYRGTRVLVADTLWESAIECHIDGVPFLIPDTAALIAHLCVHSQLHHRGLASGQLDLRSIVDLNCIYRAVGHEKMESALQQVKNTEAAATVGTLTHQAIEFGFLPRSLASAIVVGNAQQFQYQRVALGLRFPVVRKLGTAFSWARTRLSIEETTRRFNRPNTIRGAISAYRAYFGRAYRKKFQNEDEKIIRGKTS